MSTEHNLSQSEPSEPVYCVKKFTVLTVNTLSVQTEILRHIVPLVTHMMCVFFRGEGHHRNVEKLNGAHSNHEKLAKCQGLHEGQQQVGLV